jgi:hypothetical protein
MEPYIKFQGFQAKHNLFPGALNIMVESNGETDQSFGKAHLLLHIIGHFAGGALAGIAEQGFEIAQAHGQVTYAFPLHHFHKLCSRGRWSPCRWQSNPQNQNQDS